MTHYCWYRDFEGFLFSFLYLDQQCLVHFLWEIVPFLHRVHKAYLGAQSWLHPPFNILDIGGVKHPIDFAILH